MKNLRIFFITALLFTMSLSGFVATEAFAISLDQAKAQGLVGEKTDGYLGVVVNKPEAISLANDINSQRREKYLEIAKKNGTELKAVETLAAKKAISITPSGQYIQLPNGTWTKK